MPLFVFTGSSAVCVDLPSSDGATEGFYLRPSRLHELDAARYAALCKARPDLVGSFAAQPEPRKLALVAPPADAPAEPAAPPAPAAEPAAPVESPEPPRGARARRSSPEGSTGA
jgi:hypothetical protein